METESTRLLKHELRTPMNHIAGYGALLLESAEDDGREDIVQQASGIQACAKDLVLGLERALRIDSTSAASNSPNVFHQELSPIMRKLSEQLDLIDDLPDAIVYRGDLNKIRTAIQRLGTAIDARRSDVGV